MCKWDGRLTEKECVVVAGLGTPVRRGAGGSEKEALAGLAQVLEIRHLSVLELDDSCLGDHVRGRPGKLLQVVCLRSNGDDTAGEEMRLITRSPVAVRPCALSDALGQGVQREGVSVRPRGTAHLHQQSGRRGVSDMIDIRSIKGADAGRYWVRLLGEGDHFDRDGAYRMSA